MRRRLLACNIQTRHGMRWRRLLSPRWMLLHDSSRRCPVCGLTSHHYVRVQYSCCSTFTTTLALSQHHPSIAPVGLCFRHYPVLLAGSMRQSAGVKGWAVVVVVFVVTGGPGPKELSLPHDVLRRLRRLNHIINSDRERRSSTFQSQVGKEVARITLQPHASNGLATS